MLTPEQIESARNEISVALNHCDYEGRESAKPRLWFALDAIAAYVRVKSLRSELADFMASSNTRPKLAIEDVLRKLDNALSTDPLRW